MLLDRPTKRHVPHLLYYVTHSVETVKPAPSFVIFSLTI